MEIEVSNFKSKIPDLTDNIDKFKDKKQQILEEWIGSRLVVNILKKHEMDVSFFGENYAIKVLEYFFGVIDGRSLIGDCPVMDKLLTYLKNNDITSDELFLICTNARKSMISMANELDFYT